MDTYGSTGRARAPGTAPEQEASADAIQEPIDPIAEPAEENSSEPNEPEENGSSISTVDWEQKYTELLDKYSELEALHENALNELSNDITPFSQSDVDAHIAALPKSLQEIVFNFEKEPNYTITTNFISGPGIIFSGENSTAYDIDL